MRVRHWTRNHEGACCQWRACHRPCTNDQGRTGGVQCGGYFVDTDCLRPLTDCVSIDSAVDSICDLAGPLDAIVTNTDLADPVPTRRYGIEFQTIVEYIGHFALINRLSHRVRCNGGRIVLASSDVSMNHAPTEAITLHNAIDRHFYERLLSYGRAELANAIYAKELSRRLAPRGVSVNSWDSGSIRGARLDRHQGT